MLTSVCAARSGVLHASRARGVLGEHPAAGPQGMGPESTGAPTLTPFTPAAVVPSLTIDIGGTLHGCDALGMMLRTRKPRPGIQHNCYLALLQHLIIDGSPKWDIYRTVPVSAASSSAAAASMPQAVKKEAAPASAPAQRDSLLEAATAGGVLLGSGKYTFQVRRCAHNKHLHLKSSSTRLSRCKAGPSHGERTARIEQES